jgi:acyl carrier protein
MYKQVQMLLLVFILGAGGCLTRRDDSVGTVRRIVAEELSVDLAQVRAESSMGDLGCSKVQFLDLVHRLEKEFLMTLPPKEPRLRGNDDSWKSIRVIDLADLVRPEWNKPLESKIGVDDSRDTNR